MPTGYTSAVADGAITTLRDFALRCARGMSACIQMRDMPMDAPIPERFEMESSYHVERLAEARAVLAELPTLSLSECKRRAEEEHQSALAARAEHFRKDEALGARYRAMIAEVEAWDCKADGLKDFMLQQLRESLRFDCGSSERTYPPPVPPVPLGAAEWRETQMAKAEHDVAYHSKNIAEGRERTLARNRWLADLHASLPPSG